MMVMPHSLYLTAEGSLAQNYKLVVKEMFKAESVFVISKREYDENADWSS